MKKFVTNITDSEGNLLAGPFSIDENDGTFSHSFSDISLKNGLYKIWLKSPNEKLK